MADFHRFGPEPLRAAVREVVRGFGSDAREVDLVSENLVRANLYGHDSHGVGMLPRYVEAYLEGSLKPNAQPQVRIDHGPMLALDGQTGFGQSVGHAAMAMGIERAREHGTCVMALGNAHHLGRIGEWAEMAVDAGLVSIHFVNVISRPLVAAWGGRDARLGTNPFAIGIPIKGRGPFILDLATSVIAQGKARVAHNKGMPLAPGQLLDHEGRPTTNPAHAVVGPLGALLPFGEHKGFGLALACEILGGALAGGLAVHGPDEGKKRVLNGMLTVLIEPERLGDVEAFAEQTLACLDWITASPPQDGVERVLLAGEPERRSCAERQAHGIPVDGATWSAILAAADKLGIEPGRLSHAVDGDLNAARA